MTRYLALIALGMALGLYTAAPWLAPTTPADQPNQLEMNP